MDSYWLCCSGVEVTLSDLDGAKVAKKLTGKEGSVAFGPLELTAGDYSLTLKKIGYEFEKSSSQDDKILVYAAKKLAKVLFSGGQVI